MRIYIDNFPNPQTKTVTTVIIDIDNNDNLTCTELKKYIYTNYKIPDIQYYIMFNGKIIDDDTLLANIGIKDNSFLRFNLRNTAKCINLPKN